VNLSDGYSIEERNIRYLRMRVTKLIIVQREVVKGKGEHLNQYGVDTHVYLAIRGTLLYRYKILWYSVLHIPLINSR
jgi:hypothetical protein